MTKIIKRLAACLLAVTIISTNILGPIITYADEVEENILLDKEINEDEKIKDKEVYVLDIPDPKFRELIWRGLDRYYDPYIDNPLSKGSKNRYKDFNIYDEDMLLLSQVKELDIGFNNLDSIEGIHYLIGLEKLIADGNPNLKKVDLTKCFELKELKLHQCGLEEVILPKNLEKVRLDSNRISKIDLRNTRKLEWLVAFNNRIEDLDLSGLDKLEVANLDKNNIKNINLSNNIKLRELLLKDNQISELDLSDAVSLEILSLKNNKLSKLDLSNNNKLKLNKLDNLLDEQNIEIKVNKDIKSYFVKEGEIDQGVFENILNMDSSFIDGDKLRFKDISKLDYVYDTKAQTESYRNMKVKIIPKINYIDGDGDQRDENKVLVNVKYKIYGQTVKEEKMWIEVGRRISQDLFLGLPEYNKSYMTLGRNHGLKIVDRDTKEIEFKMRERLRADQADLLDLLALMEEEISREEFKKYPESRRNDFLLSIDEGRRIANKDFKDAYVDRMMQSQAAYTNIMNVYFSLEDEVTDEEFRVLEIKDKFLRKEIWKRMNREKDPYIDMELSKDSIARYKDYNIYSKDIKRLNTIGEINVSDTDIESLDGIDNLYNLAKIISNNTPKLKRVDLSKLGGLTHFYSENGGLEEVIFGNIALEHIKVRNNNLKELDFTGLDELLDVRAEGNQLTRVNTSSNQKLKFIFLDNNKLSELDFRNNKSINGMGVANNNLASLDLSENKIVGHNMILPNSTIGGQKVKAKLTKDGSIYRLKISDIMPIEEAKNISHIKNGSLSDDKDYIEFNDKKDIGYNIKTGREHDIYGLMDVEIEARDIVEDTTSGSNIVIASKPEEKPEEVEKDRIKFDDLDGSFLWAKEEVFSLVEKNIIKGKSENKFLPQDKVTRAEFVAMIIRLLELDKEEIEIKNNIEFLDVEESDWYYEYIAKGKSLNIVNGYGNGSFNPNKELTREEAIKIVGNLLREDNSKEIKDLVNKFEDVDAISKWAVDDINLTLDLGIIEGFNNYLRPQNSLNRGEAAVIIYRLMNLK